MNILKRKPISIFIIVSIVLLLLCASPIFAQTREEKLEIANRTFGEAMSLFNQKTVESYKVAREKFLEANRLYKESDDKENEAISFFWAGYTSYILGEKQKALDYYNQALLIFQETSNNSWQVATLNNIGVIYYQLDDKKKALEYYLQGLPIYKLGNNKFGEAIGLQNIGEVYFDLGDKDNALKRLEEALSLYQELGKKQEEARCLNKIGEIYNFIGDNQKSIEKYKQALDIWRTLGEQYNEAEIIVKIGENYDSLGNYDKSIEFYRQASEVYRAMLVSDKITVLPLKIKFKQALTFFKIGKSLKELGKGESSLEIYFQALNILKEVRDLIENSNVSLELKRDFSSAIQLLETTLIGRVNTSIKDLTQAAVRERDNGSKDIAAFYFYFVGGAYFYFGKNQEALEYLNQSLLLYKSLGNKKGEADVHYLIGKVLAGSEGDAQKSLEYFNQAFIFYKLTGNKKDEAMTLDFMMEVCEFLKNPRLAIFYGKQSVNTYQNIRLLVKELDKETQKIYLKSIENTYRNLAKMLISKERLSEAHQIISLFKDQQFFDFGQAKIKSIVPLAFTRRETDFLVRYEKASEQISKIGKKLEELKSKTTNRQPTTEEKTQIQKLENDLKTASDEFLAILKQAETEFSRPPDSKDKIGEVPDLKEMQTALRQLNQQTGQKAVAVYQLVGEENFSALVISEGGIEKVSSPVKGAELNEKAQRLWALLQTVKYDTTKLSKEIYDVVFAPLEAKLPKDATTIMWSLDGNLRYVPMAALWDGKQFLAERYSHAVFTRADSERMTRNVSHLWTGTGFGSSQSATVEVLGSQITFKSLPGVSEELSAIFKHTKRGILEGTVFPDKQFSKANFIEALKQKRPLVHIASHFSFRPGDEARSFLLMGDNTAFTLEEMKRETNLFQGVELLTLSACNTAAQLPGANGREVDGFAELAQRLGAGAVMATLWQVADNSTPWLMREFYNLKLNKNLTKAEALRQAQLSLLRGTSNAKPAITRTDLSPIKIVIVKTAEDRKQQEANRGSETLYIEERIAPLYVKDKSKPFAHPFYWSPFVLFGNWK